MITVTILSSATIGVELPLYCRDNLVDANSLHAFDPVRRILESEVEEFGIRSRRGRKRNAARAGRSPAPAARGPMQGNQRQIEHAGNVHDAGVHCNYARGILHDQAQLRERHVAGD